MTASKGVSHDCIQPRDLLWVPSGSVREIETKDGAVLLDIRQGLCLSMNPVGMKIWHHLKLNQLPDQIANSLARDCPKVPRQQIHDELLQFISALSQNGLLVARSTLTKEEPRSRLLRLIWPRHSTAETDPDDPASVTRFLLWKALFGLLAFDLLNRDKNFTRIHACVRDWPVDCASAPPNIVERVSRAINHACAWYPKRVLCLQRSSVTVCLLRNCGVPARMVIGAQKFPFKAHAWTEIDGCSINERRDVQHSW